MLEGPFNFLRLYKYLYFGLSLYLSVYLNICNCTKTWLCTENEFDAKNISFVFKLTLDEHTSHKTLALCDN